jgi:ABC-type multidrug transport system ATPase subunit
MHHKVPYAIVLRKAPSCRVVQNRVTPRRRPHEGANEGPTKGDSNPEVRGHPGLSTEEDNQRMTTTTLPARSPGRASDSPWAVETHGLTKRFGDNVAVNDVELLIPRGCAFGYLGPNGAGKTTLIRVLLGLTHADAGSMSLLGYPVPKHRDAALARVGAIVDEPRFHGHLTGRENLRILAAAREPAARERIGPSLERVGILHRADDRVSKYSMGMRQRLGVAACLIGDPQLLILDEPMNGLDPAGMQDMRDMILSLVAEGRTVVLSSHLLDEVERTCDAVAIVDRGRVIRQGSIAELLAGSSLVIQVDCSEPDRASALLDASSVKATIGARIEVGPLGLGITLPAGTGRDVNAEINRVLVEGGIAVYRLQEIQASLESWFLQVTSRLGDPE